MIAASQCVSGDYWCRKFEEDGKELDNMAVLLKVTVYFAYRLVVIWWKGLGWRMNTEYFRFSTLEHTWPRL